MNARTIVGTMGGIITFMALLPFYLLLAFPIIFFPPAIRFKSRWFYGVNSFFARLVLRATGLRLQVENAGKLEILKNTPAIIVLNHQSLIDAVVVEMLLGSQPRITFSNDYSSKPLFGLLLERMHVIVRRATARSSQAALDKAAGLANNYGNHIVIFPEGTRHADGKIHKFYRGFTVLAVQLNRPVVPIFLYGLHQAMPKGSCSIKVPDNDVLIRIGDSFVFNEALETREEFLEKVHNWFTLECGRVNPNQ